MPPERLHQARASIRDGCSLPENASPGRKHRQFITAGEVRLRVSRSANIASRGELVVVGTRPVRPKPPLDKLLGLLDT